MLAAFGGLPRFARRGLASLGLGLATLGLAELRKWLSSVGACVFLCSANPWKGKARQSSRAGAHKVAYQTVVLRAGQTELIKWRTKLYATG